ncbi:ABC-three component system middle component 8 [Martelella lutilitoris]|uniref:ABC-three component system middle component 8 n=1 Tax=Martelella lutilitoris TaxID=2583532 RepID=UPI0026D07C62
MLRAKKHIDPNTCTLRVITLVLGELLRRRTVTFDELRNFVVRRAGPDAELAFLPAMEVIFLLGRVEYREKTDSFEYVVV